jgi:hypothetical protein
MKERKSKGAFSVLITHQPEKKDEGKPAGLPEVDVHCVV